MYMKTPMMFGRPMKKVKEYEHHVVFVDEKLGIRQSFQYWDLTHEIIDHQVYAYADNGDLIPVNEIKRKENTTIKKSIKNDNRLNEIIAKGDFYEELLKNLI